MYDPQTTNLSKNQYKIRAIYAASLPDLHSSVKTSDIEAIFSKERQGHSSY